MDYTKNINVSWEDTSKVETKSEVQATETKKGILDILKHMFVKKTYQHSSLIKIVSIWSDDTYS